MTNTTNTTPPILNPKLAATIGDMIGQIRETLSEAMADDAEVGDVRLWLDAPETFDEVDHPSVMDDEDLEYLHGWLDGVAAVFDLAGAVELFDIWQKATAPEKEG